MSATSTRTQADDDKASPGDIVECVAEAGAHQEYRPGREQPGRHAHAGCPPSCRLAGERDHPVAARPGPRSRPRAEHADEARDVERRRQQPPGDVGRLADGQLNAGTGGKRTAADDREEHANNPHTHSVSRPSALRKILAPHPGWRFSAPQALRPAGCRAAVARPSVGLVRAPQRWERGNDGQPGSYRQCRGGGRRGRSSRSPGTRGRQRRNGRRAAAPGRGPGVPVAAAGLRAGRGSADLPCRARRVPPPFRRPRPARDARVHHGRDRRAHPGARAGRQARRPGDRLGDRARRADGFPAEPAGRPGDDAAVWGGLHALDGLLAIAVACYLYGGALARRRGGRARVTA